MSLRGAGRGGTARGSAAWPVAAALAFRRQHGACSSSNGPRWRSQQLLVALQALRRRAAHDGCNGAPLRGHELGQVQQLLVLLRGAGGWRCWHAGRGPAWPAAAPAALPTSRVHSVFLIAGSSHSYQRALHCLALLRTSSDEMRAHWFRPYLEGGCRRRGEGSRGWQGGGVSRAGRHGARVAMKQPHFITAALRISSSVFFHTPPLMRTVEGMSMSGTCRRREVCGGSSPTPEAATRAGCDRPRHIQRSLPLCTEGQPGAEEAPSALTPHCASNSARRAKWGPLQQR